MIYICIPCHNEERTVGVLLWKIRQVMAGFPRDYQILVVDDASTDATRKVVEPYQRVLPVTVARNAERRGYAAAVELLLQEAVRRSRYPRRDCAIVMQADFTHDPAEIPALVKRVEAGADIVIGAAAPLGPTVPRGLRWARTIVSTLLRRLRWPEGVTDPLSGYRAYRIVVARRALESLQGGLPRGASWATDVALLRAAAPHARRTDETPVTIHEGRRQRASRFDPWAASRQVVGWVWSSRRGGSMIAAPGEPDDSAERVEAAPRGERPERGERPGRGKRSDRAGRGAPGAPQAAETIAGAGDAVPVGEAAAPKRRRSRSRRRSGERGRGAEAPTAVAQQQDAAPVELTVESGGAADAAAGGTKRRRRRGGRGRRRGGSNPENGASDTGVAANE